LRINAVKPWKKPDFHCVFYAVLCYTCGFHCNFNSLREFYWFPSLLVIVSPWAPCWVWAWSLLTNVQADGLTAAVRLDWCFFFFLVAFVLPAAGTLPVSLIREYITFCCMNQGYWMIPLWVNTKIGWPDGGMSNVYDR
jgi:hypothetical protein